MNLLNIRIDNITKKQALEKVSTFLESKKQCSIFTPNPEMLVDAQKDTYFRKVLNTGDINIPDGFGLSLVTGGKIKRIPGVDFMLELCKLAEQKKYSVYFLGSGSDNVIKNLKSKVKSQFPNLTIVGTNPGHHIQLGDDRLILDKEKNDDLIADITMAKPDILFVAFGHNKQEKWLYEYFKDLPRVTCAMGVGGSFDYISETKKRAPQWMRSIGLEWLYRFTKEPRRLKRMWKATVVFIFYCIFLKKKQI